MVKVKRQPIRGDVSKKAIKKPKNNKKDKVYQLYQKYLKSKEFKGLREKALERDGHKCQFCNRSAEEIADNKKINLQIHHKCYDHLGDYDENELDDVITTCNICHKSMHSAPSNLRRFSDKSHILISNYVRNDVNNEF